MTTKDKILKQINWLTNEAKENKKDIISLFALYTILRLDCLQHNILGDKEISESINRLLKLCCPKELLKPYYWNELPLHPLRWLPLTKDD
jgi:hypothetical protein